MSSLRRTIKRLAEGARSQYRKEFKKRPRWRHRKPNGSRQGKSKRGRT